MVYIIVSIFEDYKLEQTYLTINLSGMGHYFRLLKTFSILWGNIVANLKDKQYLIKYHLAMEKADLKMN